MSRDRYVHLIEEFCQSSKLGEPARVVQGGAIDFDDIPFSLLYSKKINPAALLIYGEFGTPPAGQEAEALRILLQKNLRSYDGDGGPAFTMSTSGKVLIAHRLPLSDASARQLHDLLSDLADKAKLWRKDFRLDKPATNATPPQRRPVRIQMAWSQQSPDSLIRPDDGHQDMLDKRMNPKQGVARQGDVESVAKRVRHSTNPPPVKLSELEEEHESQAGAKATSGKLHETPAGVRMRAALSSEIGKPAIPE